jgi:hypothetical protein
MAANNTHTKTKFIAFCTTLAAGVTAMADTTFLLGGKSLTKAEVVGPLDAYVAATAQTAQDKTTYETSLQQERAAEEAARGIVDQLKPFLQGRLGKSNPALETQFGIAPQKKAQKTVAVKAGAIAKSKATGAVRGTQGAKQKKALIASPAQTPPAAAPSPGAATTPAKPTA